MIDILDELQNINGLVKLTLTSGETVFGVPDCIVWDEDEEGWETIKNIRVEPVDSVFAKYYKVEDIKSYEEIHSTRDMVDGEYDRPLPERTLNPTEEDMEKLEKLLEKYPKLKDEE